MAHFFETCRLVKIADDLFCLSTIFLQLAVKIAYLCLFCLSTIFLQLAVKIAYLFLFIAHFSAHEISRSRRGVGTEDFRDMFLKLTHFLIPFLWKRDSKVEVRAARG